jgi:hypothetical protein
MTTEITEDNLIWTVLDAPRIEPRDWELFWKSWNTHAGASYLAKDDPAGNRDSGLVATGKRTEFFKGLNIYAASPSALEDGHWKLPFLDYREIFPNVLEDLYAALPWVAEIEMCRLWMSNQPIPYHRDHTREDVALRAMIYNENPKGTFKVFKPSVGVNYVELPPETNVFAYNNAKCMHGSDREEGVNKIILLTIHKTKDKQAMVEHFKQSAEKYPTFNQYD